MNNINKIYKGILPFAFLAFMAQTAVAQEASEEVTKGDTLNVAFRKADARDVITPVSSVNVKALMEKNYSTYSLDNMQALTAGYNGQLWNMGEALVLIDGVPRDADNVLPSEIEDITFLKGASAVVLYGSRAAKGAILITTKRGTEKPLTINARLDYQMFTPKAYPSYLSAPEYMTYYNQALANDGLAAKYSAEDIYNTASGVNPYRYPNLSFYNSDYLKKSYSRYDATAEFEGGGKNAQFYTNISYNRTGSLLNFGEGKKDYSDRLNIRGNIDLQLADWVSGWVDANATYYNQRGSNSDFWGAAATLRPNRITPLVPISYVEGDDAASNVLIKNSKHIIDGQYFLNGTQEDPTNAIADMYAAGYNTWTCRQMQFDAGVKLDLASILKGLSFKTQFAVDYKSSYSTSMNDKYATYAPTWTQYDGKQVISSLTKYGKDEHNGTLNASNSAETQTIAWNGQFDYQNTFAGVHNVNATLVANGYQKTVGGEYHKTSNANLGLQVSYNYAHKYYVDLAGNAVHSAKLAKGHREAFSPSATLGWRISEENFLKDVKWINDLRITGGYTVLNEDLDISDYYMYESIFTATGTWWGWSDSNNSIQTSDSQRGGNDELTFIKRKELNFGINGSFFNNHLKVALNYYRTKFDGTIVQPDLLYPSYFHTYWPVSTFVGYVNNDSYIREGMDFSVGYENYGGEFGYGVQVFGQLARSENDVYTENVEYDYMKHSGRATDAMWGLECLGYYESQADIDNSPKSSFATVKPGDLKYKDQNGDGVIDSKDEVVIGKWSPTFTGGMNFTLKYKNFSLYAMITGQFGGMAMKNSDYYWVYGEKKYSSEVLGAWTSEKAANGEPITFPRLTTQGGDNNFRSSDYWMYTTDRIDLQRVQLTYDFPAKLVSGKVVKGLQAYVSGSSLLTIAENKKILERNVGSAPQTRSYTLGAKITF